MAQLNVINRNDLFVIRDTDPEVIKGIKQLDEAYSDKMMTKEERNQHDKTAVPAFQAALRNVSNTTLVIYLAGVQPTSGLGEDCERQGISQTSLIMEEIKHRVEEMSKGNPQYMDKAAESLLYFAGKPQTAQYRNKEYNSIPEINEFINKVKTGQADYKDWKVHYDNDHATLTPEQEQALNKLREFQQRENQNTSEATPSNPKDPLKEAQNAAIAELKKLQAERGWNDEALKEHISKINELTSLEAIQTYLEKQKNQDSTQEGENTQEDEATQEGEATQETTDRSTATTEENTASEDKPKKSTTVNEVKHDSETENTNDDWKKLRREEWEKYAAQERQEFKLLSEDKAPDLNMSVGGTSINYANEHEVTMANTDEYSKFVKLIEIEKKAHTDVINFGEIQSEDYRSKLAAACLQVGLEMKNGPKHIDLSLDCFKNLDDATKQKIEAYNRKQAEREQSNQSEQGNESKPEPTAEGNANNAGNEGKPESTTEGNSNSNGEGNESKPEPTAADTKNKTKEEYQKLYEAKLAELKAKKEKGESVDFSSIKDPVDRILTYAAAKENDVNMENITNELLWNRRQHEDRKDDVDTAASILPSERFKDVKFHDKRVRETNRSNIRRRVRAQGNNSANQATPQNNNPNNSSENQVVAAQVGRQNEGR